MSARLSWNQQNARGHRPRLQCRIQFVNISIDRPYSLGSATVGALYERPRSIFCAKPFGWNRCNSGFIDKGGESFDFVCGQIQIWHLGRFDTRISEKCFEVIRWEPLPGKVESSFRCGLRVNLNVSMASDTAFRCEETNSLGCWRERCRRRSSRSVSGKWLTVMMAQPPAYATVTRTNTPKSGSMNRTHCRFIVFLLLPELRHNFPPPVEHPWIERHDAVASYISWRRQEPRQPVVNEAARFRFQARKEMPEGQSVADTRLAQDGFQLTRAVRSLCPGI